MTQTKIYLSVFIILLFSACNLKKGTVKFNMKYSEEITVPSSFGVDLPVDISTPGIQSNSSNTFKNNDTRSDLIESIKLKELSLTITSPENRDFDILKSIEIYIKTESLPEILLASRTDIPDNIGNTLILNTSNENFANYIKADKFELQTKIVTRKATNSQTLINAVMLFKVEAKVFN
jgi:hypothetical protein